MVQATLTIFTLLSVDTLLAMRCLTRISVPLQSQEKERTKYQKREREKETGRL